MKRIVCILIFILLFLNAPLFAAGKKGAAGKQINTTISPIYSGSTFDQNLDGVGDNPGTDYYEGGQPTVGMGEYGNWVSYAAKANAEYDISSLSGKTIESALLTADAWYSKDGALTVSWYYYQGDGVRSAEDYHQSATLIGTTDFFGDPSSLSLDVTNSLQTFIDAGAAYIAFRGERSAGTGSIGWYEPIDLEITYLDNKDDEVPPDEEPPLVLPEITSFSPSILLIPGETVITINGTGFGSSYIAGGNQICFENNGCISNGDINTYLISWTETEIQMLVPEYITISGRIGLVLKIPGTDQYGIAYSTDYFTIAPPPDPEITSISPDVLTPDIVVTITGHGFGDEYLPGYNQICFNDNCISDGAIPFYLQTWTDTKITIKIPSFVTEDSGTIGLKVYFPATGYYNFIESPTYTVKHKPIIEWYYYQMEQGGTYTYSGYYFGQTPGKVIINGLECEVVEWSDTDVTFIIPSNASSGNIYIETAEGLKSNELYVIIISIKTYSNDEYSRYQWHLGTINIEDAWKITEGSSDVIVAVIDSGVDINHEDLSHAIWTNSDETAGNNKDDDNNGYIDDIHGWDFVLNTNSTATRGDHGTMVSSMIAAKKDNGIGLAGIAPKVKIMPLNVAIDEFYIDVDAAVAAIKYAVDNGADIINMSFGGPDSLIYYEDIIKYAYDNNVLIVASTGNEGSDLDYYSSYAPVCVDIGHNAVIGVAATNEYDTVSYFSNYGALCTDLAAPGEYLPVAVPSDAGYYGTADGTSFSSPLVAGIAALIKSSHPDWNVEEIKYVLLNTARNVDDINPYYEDKIGRGIPDAYAALKAAKPSVSYTYNPTTEIEIEETGATIEIEIPEVTPITDEPELVKDESIEEEKSEKNTEPEIYEPVALETSFSDAVGHKYEGSIAYLENLEIIHGYPDGTFKPDYEINRAEFTKIIVNAFVDQSAIYGSYCFPDVEDDWYASYVCTAKRLGILQGYPDGTFKPARNVNTVEALKIIIEMQGVELYAAPWDDWFAPYVLYAINTNLDFILYENAFDENIKRGQMAEMIYVILKGLL